MARGVRIEISGSRVRAYLNDPNGDVQRDLRRRSREVQRKARALAPGRMKTGIIIGSERRGGRREFHVTSTHPASLFVIEGTRPHMIRAVRRKALKFRAGGRTLFRRRVNHPGVRKNNFLTRALQEARR